MPSQHSSSIPALLLDFILHLKEELSYKECDHLLIQCKIIVIIIKPNANFKKNKRIKRCNNEKMRNRKKDIDFQVPTQK